MLKKIYKSLALFFEKVSYKCIDMEFDRAEKDRKNLQKVEKALFEARAKVLLEIKELETEYQLED